MPAPFPVQLATITRGAAHEALIRGHLVVADAEGQVLAAAGDPDSRTTVRSCVKPLQALPFVRRAAGTIGASDADIAIACASHSGEPQHVAAVRELLGRAGIPEAALSCGPQLPSDAEAARELLAAGGAALPIHNNCSGKHAAMLAVCHVAGWPIERYAAYDHPLQVEIRGLMSGYAGVTLDAEPHGIDGCGLPTHELPLRVLARMYAAAAADGALAPAQSAMARHPHLVGGRHSFDTALLAAAGVAVTVKVGGAAVWIAVQRPGGPALAIKLEAGDAGALPPVALTALVALGWIDGAAATEPGLSAHARPAVTNWAGAVVGHIDIDPGWAAGFAR